MKVNFFVYWLSQAVDSKAVAFLKRNVWYFYFGGFALAEIAFLLYKAAQ